MSAQVKFLLILLGIFVIAGLLGMGGWVLFRNIQGASQNLNSSPVLTNISPVISVNGMMNVNVSGILNQEPVLLNASGSDSSEEEVKVLARSFAERYGSYSSKNAYQNLRDLKSFMTDRLWRASEQTMLSASASDEYFGVTSRALQVELQAMESDQAKVQVTLQRRESKGQSDPRVFYQTLTLELNVGGGAWLVDELAWGSVF